MWLLPPIFCVPWAYLKQGHKVFRWICISEFCIPWDRWIFCSNTCQLSVYILSHPGRCFLKSSLRRSPLIQEAPPVRKTSAESQAIYRFNVPKTKSLSNDNISIKNSMYVIIVHNNAVKVAIWFCYCLCSNSCPLSGRKMTRPFRWEHTIRWRTGICDEFVILKSLIYLHDGREEPASCRVRE